MKLLLIAICLTFEASGQGLLEFTNRNLFDANDDSRPLYHAPVYLPDGTPVEGPRFTAGLFLVQSSDLKLIITTPFRNNGIGFFVPVSPLIPDAPGGLPATFRSRVWETSAGSYEAAISGGQYYGEFVTSSGSPDIFVPRLGHVDDRNFPTPTLYGIQPLTLIPEPTFLALSAVGAAMFVFIAARRHKRV